MATNTEGVSYSHLKGKDAKYCDAAVVQYVRNMMKSLGVQMLTSTTTPHTSCVLRAARCRILYLVNCPFLLLRRRSLEYRILCDLIRFRGLLEYRPRNLSVFGKSTLEGRFAGQDLLEYRILYLGSCPGVLPDGSFAACRDIRQRRRQQLQRLSVVVVGAVQPSVP